MRFDLKKTDSILNPYRGILEFKRTHVRPGGTSIIEYTEVFYFGSTKSGWEFLEYTQQWHPPLGTGVNGWTKKRDSVYGQSEFPHHDLFGVEVNNVYPALFGGSNVILK